MGAATMPAAAAPEANEKKPDESLLEKAIANTRPPNIEFGDTGLIPKTLDELWRVAVMIHKSGLYPRGIDTPEKITVALSYGRELGLTTSQSLTNMMVVNNRPAIWGDMPLAIVQKRAGDALEDFFEDWFGEGDEFGAVCEIKRKGRSRPTIRTFTIGEAERAKLFKNETWQKYPKRMLQCRSRAFALRDTFPEILMGFPIYEEHVGLDDVINETNRQNSTRSVSLSSLNSRMPAIPNVPAETPAANAPAPAAPSEPAAPPNEAEKPATEEKSIAKKAPKAGKAKAEQPGMLGGEIATKEQVAAASAAAAKAGLAPEDFEKILDEMKIKHVDDMTPAQAEEIVAMFTPKH